MPHAYVTLTVREIAVNFNATCGKYAVTERRNNTYAVLFQFLMGQDQIRTLLQFCDATDWSKVYRMYKRCVRKEQYTKFIIDASGNTLRFHTEGPDVAPPVTVALSCQQLTFGSSFCF